MNLRVSVIFLFLFALAGCLPTAEKTSNLTDADKNPSPYSPTADIYYIADIVVNPMDLDQVPLASELIANKPSNPRYAMVSGPSWMSVDPVTGKFSFNTIKNQEPVYFKVKAYENLNPGNYSTSNTLSVAVNGDPLRYQQWHLANDGSVKTYAIYAGGVPNIDINVNSVFEAGITGSGVKIAVSDSGAETNHDDLKDNAVLTHKDFTLPSPYIGTPTPTSAHGTAVSGIIAAKGWNNKGGIGVAPNAQLGIFQFLSSAQSEAILIAQASGDYNIFNYSYGDTLLYDTTSDENYLDHLRYQALTNKKFFVKAAGNEYALGNNDNLCAPHNANAPFENESPFQIVVGAINAEGEKALYSNVGSNIWVSAPGGEYGDTDPAILTTDLPTCFKGYSKAVSFPTNDFEYGHSENPKCNYTSTMNGTSAAAPMVSGIIALILEANPNLSYRDVKHILAMSATRVDPNMNNPFGVKHPSERFSGCQSFPMTNNLQGHAYELGWVQNKANIYFNNFYGFGLVDAASAVSLAQDISQDPMNWLPLPAQVELNPDFTGSTYNKVVSLGIPDAHKGGVSAGINVASSIKVETVQVKVQVTHPKSGEVGIELTSPMGTKSILLNINNSFILDNDKNLNIVLTSHAFYGESANGTWTIKVLDGKEGNSGTFTFWGLNILGH